MDILNSIPILTEEDVTKEVKISLDDIKKIHKSLTMENPMTFQIFLSKRPDIIGEEREVYLKIIERLKNNERIRYQTAMKEMIDADYGRLDMKQAPMEIDEYELLR